MTTFVLIAAVMVAAALAWVLVPLLRHRTPAGIGREASNVAILRDQQAELDADLANGALSREQYEQARRELEQRVIEESRAATPAAAVPAQSAALTAAVLGGAIPIAALLLYVTLGDFGAFAPGAARQAKAGSEHDVSDQEIDAMAARLAAKLEKEPANVDGWVMLARTYYARKRHAEAARAFDRAVALAPDNADLLADYADSLAAATGGGLTGKPLELVQRALKADPTHWKALALAGTAAFNRKDYQQAVDHWEKMKATVPPGSPIAGSIDASIAEARELGGLKVPAGAAPATAAAPPKTAAAPPKAAAVPPKGAAPAGLASGATAGTVKIAAALAGKAAPDDTVYIIARAAEGSKTPLAILRKQVKDLPASFALDDSMAMAPNFALSNFASIVVGARVSKSGNASAQSGDLEGWSPIVRPGTTGIDIVIDRTLP